MVAVGSPTAMIPLAGTLLKSLPVMETNAPLLMVSGQLKLES